MPRVPTTDYSAVDRLRATLQAGTESLRRQQASDFDISQQLHQRSLARQQAEFRQAAVAKYRESVSPTTMARLKGLTPEQQQEERFAAGDELTVSLLGMNDVPGAAVAERMRERPMSQAQSQPKLTNERFTVRNSDGTQKDVLHWYSDGKFLREEEVKTGVSPDAAKEKRDYEKESKTLREETLKRIADLRKENVTLGTEMSRIDGKLFEYKDLNDEERASFKADRERLLADNEEEMERLNISVGGTWRRGQKPGAGAAGGGGKTEPPKTDEPKVLDMETATKILEEAGGDEEKARKIAKERGYKF